jgi:hypothetical protein
MDSLRAVMAQLRTVSTPPVPLEDEEQAAFVQWLELVGLRFSSIPNATYTTSWKQKSKNYYTGLRAGFPDLVVLVPPSRAQDGIGHMLCIEMKRRQGGTVSAVQKDWIEAINGLSSISLEAVVCKGAQDAIEHVNRILRPRPISPF